jgi:phosphoglycolate phosphatase
LRDFLIFDLDGTLVDSNAVCVEILQSMLDERGAGIVIDRETASVHMSRGGAQMVAALLGPACGEPDAELIEFRARYAERMTPPASMFSGVAQGLTRLQQSGFGLAIYSNKPQNLCDKVLGDLGIGDAFEVIVGGRAGCRPKPTPDLLDCVLDTLGADAGRCAMIGDSELDHALAEGARMPFCFMTYGYAAPDWRPCSKTRCFDDFGGLVDMFVTTGPQSIIRPRAA